MASYKRFVRGSEDTLDTTSSAIVSDNKARNKRSCQATNGTDTQSFYDQLVGLSTPENPAHELKNDTKNFVVEEKKAVGHPDLPSTSNVWPQRLRSLQEPKTEKQLKRLRNDFLKHAQEGELDELKRCKKAGVDVNHVDIYGWNALMCAAYAGHKDIVRWLLEAGADASLRNNQHKTAISLAKKRSITRLFTNHEKGLSLDPQGDIGNAGPEKFLCDVCKQEFSNTTPEVHQTSMIHLFNSQKKPETTHYYIPPANKGFQLLVRGGWEPEKGLGVEGQGRKYPIKTILKRDRKGIGGREPVPAKVTHFNPHDRNAVAMPVNIRVRTMKASTLSKKQRKKKLSKEQAKARDFRLEFYSQ